MLDFRKSHLKTDDYMDLISLDNKIHAMKYLKNRKVCLLGGMKETDTDIRFNLKHCDLFGDLFVQLNHHPLERPDQPCDWLITRGEGVTVADYKAAEIKPQILSFDLDKEDAPEYYQWGIESRALMIPFCSQLHYQLPEWNLLFHRLKCRPLMGVLALEMIRQFPVLKIFVAGMDLYPGKTMRDSHYLPTHREYMRTLWHGDYRIDADITLQVALQLESCRRGIIPTYNMQEES